jgi:hypothetical protein
LWVSPYEVGGVRNDSASINCEAVSVDFSFRIRSESVSILADFFSKKKPDKSILLIAPSMIAAH